jgi:two-component system nitrogen regulation response regulator GlnG
MVKYRPTGYRKEVPMPRVLIVDDEPSVVSLVTRSLQKLEGYEVLAAESGEEARAMLAEGGIDVAIFDVLLPGESGLDLMETVKQVDSKLPVIFITGGGTAGNAIEAMKAGAFDYLSKPLDVAELRTLVAHAAEIRRLMTTPVGVAHSVQDAVDSSGDLLVGRSAAMTEVYKSIGRVAPRNATVLVRGESGTGKELVARSIYQHSERSDKPFLAVNCAAIPETLLESELFGHEKGAFTGADRRRIGKFEQCNGGTLFLDEIGDMPLPLQGKILRLIQDQRFERVGGNETIQTDVRIITATHRNLEEMSEDGRFRTDLYYRLNVFEIVIPPLRDRLEDLPILVGHFLKRISADLKKDVNRISGEAMDVLRAYDWPGNIRELQSILKKAVLNAYGPMLLPEFLPTPLAGSAVSSDNGSDAVGDETCDWDRFADELMDSQTGSLYDEVLQRMERWLITRVLRRTAGNQVQAAGILGITRTTLRSKLAKLGLSIEKVVGDDSDDES